VRQAVAETNIAMAVFRLLALRSLLLLQMLLTCYVTVGLQLGTDCDFDFLVVELYTSRVPGMLAHLLRCRQEMVGKCP
jgi:hypothetical protein